MSTPSNSPVIPSQVPPQEEQQSHRTPVDDTSMDVDTGSQTVNEAFQNVETGGAASTSTHSSNFVHKWLNPVHHNDQGSGPSTVHLLSDEQLAELNEEQLEGLQKLTQQLLTSNLSNQDYQAILLGYRTDVEANQQKIVDEDEDQGNVDHWLSKEFKSTIDEALAAFREEYLTFLGSSARTLSNSQL